MTAHTARLASRTRLQEIQALIDRVGSPDRNWAEVLLRTDEGTWTQAFQVRDGRAYPLTEVILVPSHAA